MAELHPQVAEHREEPVEAGPQGGEHVLHAVEVGSDPAGEGLAPVDPAEHDPAVDGRPVVDEEEPAVEDALPAGPPHCSPVLLGQRLGVDVVHVERQDPAAERLRLRRPGVPGHDHVLGPDGASASCARAPRPHAPRSTAPRSARRGRGRARPDDQRGRGRAWPGWPARRRCPRSRPPAPGSGCACAGPRCSPRGRSGSRARRWPRGRGRSCAPRTRSSRSTAPARPAGRSRWPARRWSTARIGPSRQRRGGSHGPRPVPAPAARGESGGTSSSGTRRSGPMRRSRRTGPRSPRPSGSARAAAARGRSTDP